MNITKVLYNVYVVPNYNGKSNVIQRVRWGIVFEKDGFTSEAGIETTLDISDTGNFISIDNLGNTEVLEWAYQAQGGDGFLSYITPHHEEQVDYAILCAGQVEYTEGFDLQPIKVLPLSSAPSGTIPATVI
jgi:hypothetical protein